jgi:hypothetical protein
LVGLNTARAVSDLPGGRTHRTARNAQQPNLLAMAALRASIGHMGSDSAPTVAEGLNTISAPLRPKACLLLDGLFDIGWNMSSS